MARSSFYPLMVNFNSYELCTIRQKSNSGSGKYTLGEIDLEMVKKIECTRNLLGVSRGLSSFPPLLRIELESVSMILPSNRESRPGKHSLGEIRRKVMKINNLSPAR